MKKGFTLIELLAVMIILALVLVIAVPMIFGVIEKAKMGAVESDAKLIYDALKKKIAMNDKYEYTDVTEDNIEAELGIKPDNYQDLVITEVDGKPRVFLIGKNKYEGYVAYGNESNMTVVRSEDYDTTPPVITLLGNNPIDIEQGSLYSEPGATAVDDHDGDISQKIVISGTVNKDVAGNYTITYKVSDTNGNESTLTRTVNVVKVPYAGPNYIASKGVNGPVLATGMVPIKWDGTKWVDTDIYDSSWYNYTNTDKKWANARTSDCTNPADPSTCSMWVWIPRYAYQIATNYHTTTDGTINIKYLKNNTNVATDSSTVDTVPTYSGSSQTNYILHPTFNFGGTQVTGIWVAKFEASVSNTSDLCFTSESAGNCDKSTIKPKIAPNVRSWRYINIGNAFTASRNMETDNIYGWGTTGSGIDTHLIKNLEWGAVAYLSKSSYGKASEVWINPSDTFVTGCAGDSLASALTTGCLRTYETTNGQNASTTGNIYGIYDMNGGSEEHVSANYNNQISSSTINPSSILDKYIDRYSGSNYGYNSTIYGDAVYETSVGAVWNGTTWVGSSYGSWYADRSSMPNTSSWFRRSGRNNDTNSAGIYYYANQNGAQYSYAGFRPVLYINSGL